MNISFDHMSQLMLISFEDDPLFNGVSTPLIVNSNHARSTNFLIFCLDISYHILIELREKNAFVKASHFSSYWSEALTNIN